MEGGFLERRPLSPTGIALVLALHGAGLAALATWKMEVFVPKIPATKIYHVPEPPAPPPEPEPPSNPKSQPDPMPAPTRVPRIVELPRLPDVVPALPDPVVIADPSPVAGSGAGEGTTAKSIPPPPLRVEAQLDPKSERQPPYPSSEQRLEREGKVTVRLSIGADGRVKSVARIRATSDAFFEATERHALRHWRFRPATVDGRAVPSEKVQTVLFRLR